MREIVMSANFFSTKPQAPFQAYFRRKRQKYNSSKQARRTFYIGTQRRSTSNLVDGNPKAKSYYITTPIFYPNSVPHIGHLYSLVTGDVFARFQRLQNPNRDVHFLAGTDEHGLKIQKAAKDSNMEPLVFCDKISKRFKFLAEKANISHTRFMRTSEKSHHETVERVWRYLDKKSLIYKSRYSGWYSVSDECFYPPSQVTQVPSAQGEPEFVISTETGNRVEWNEEENYMFRLSTFRERLQRHYTNNPEIIVPSQHHEYILDVLTGKWGELEDLSISRPKGRLSWGVGVPGDGNHTIYVWFDALSVYLSGIGFPGSKTENPAIWPADMQIIGKDILRFHAIYFPAMLMALDLPLPKRLLSHAHWTVNQKKMSKSIGNVADPFEAMDRFGVDAVRYYLARVGGRFKDDVDWSDQQLEKYRAEIVAYLGNFFMRITSKKIVENVKKGPKSSLEECISPLVNGEPNKTVYEMLRELPDRVAASLLRIDAAAALQEIVDVLKRANAAMTTTAPWSSSPGVARVSFLTSLETLRVCGICLQPFVPSVAGSLLDALSIPVDERTWDSAHRGKGKVQEGQVKHGTKLF